MRYLLLFVIPIIAFASCRCSQAVECRPSEQILPCFSGFQPDELDTLVVKIYKAGSNFSVLTDSFFHDTSKEIARSFGPEVCPVVDLMRGKGIDNDFEVILPGAGRTYRFSEITYEGPLVQEKEYRCGSRPDPCSRRLVSYRLNGELKTGPGNFATLKK